jgi:hypothetical protein
VFEAKRKRRKIWDFLWVFAATLEKLPLRHNGKYYRRSFVNMN